jgi:hypothetical protein
MFTHLIAQTSPAADTVEPWLKVFFWLAGGIWCVVKLIKEFTPPKPSSVAVSGQPLEVKKHGGIVTDDDLRNVHGRINRERSEVDQALAELKAEDRRLRDKLDGEIKELNGRIDEVPQRTIALLRETKGLI